MLKLLNGNASLPLSPETIAAYRHHVLEELKHHLPPGVQENFDADMDAIVHIDKDFDISALRKKVNEKNNFPPGKVNGTITSLNSRGFFSYNSRNRHYTLHRLIRDLWQKADSS